MGTGYNDLPPEWTYDVFRWLIIAACFAPIVLPLCLFVMSFIYQCAQRGPCCPSCGQPWSDDRG